MATTKDRLFIRAYLDNRAQYNRILAAAKIEQRTSKPKLSLYMREAGLEKAERILAKQGAA